MSSRSFEPTTKSKGSAHQVQLPSFIQCGPNASGSTAKPVDDPLGPYLSLRGVLNEQDLQMFIALGHGYALSYDTNMLDEALIEEFRLWKIKHNLVYDSSSPSEIRKNVQEISSRIVEENGYKGATADNVPMDRKRVPSIDAETWGPDVTKSRVSFFAMLYACYGTHDVLNNAPDGYIQFIKSVEDKSTLRNFIDMFKTKDAATSSASASAEPAAAVKTAQGRKDSGISIPGSFKAGSQPRNSAVKSGATCLEDSVHKSMRPNRFSVGAPGNSTEYSEVCDVVIEKMNMLGERLLPVNGSNADPLGAERGSSAHSHAAASIEDEGVTGGARFWIYFSNVLNLANVLMPLLFVLWNVAIWKKSHRVIDYGARDRLWGRGSGTISILYYVKLCLIYFGFMVPDDEVSRRNSYSLEHAAIRAYSETVSKGNFKRAEIESFREIISNTDIYAPGNSVLYNKLTERVKFTLNKMRNTFSECAVSGGRSDYEMRPIANEITRSKSNGTDASKLFDAFYRTLHYCASPVESIYATCQEFFNDSNTQDYNKFVDALRRVMGYDAEMSRSHALQRYVSRVQAGTNRVADAYTAHSAHYNHAVAEWITPHLALYQTELSGTHTVDDLRASVPRWVTKKTKIPQSDSNESSFSNFLTSNVAFKAKHLMNTAGTLAYPLFGMVTAAESGASVKADNTPGVRELTRPDKYITVRTRIQLSSILRLVAACFSEAGAFTGKFAETLEELLPDTDLNLLLQSDAQRADGTEAQRLRNAELERQRLTAVANRRARSPARGERADRPGAAVPSPAPPHIYMGGNYNHFKKWQELNMVDVIAANIEKDDTNEQHLARNILKYFEMACTQDGIGKLLDFDDDYTSNPVTNIAETDMHKFMYKWTLKALKTCIRSNTPTTFNIFQCAMFSHIFAFLMGNIDHIAYTNTDVLIWDKIINCHRSVAAQDGVNAAFSMSAEEFKPPAIKSFQTLWSDIMSKSIVITSFKRMLTKLDTPREAQNDLKQIVIAIPSMLPILLLPSLELISAIAVSFRLRKYLNQPEIKGIEDAANSLATKISEEGFVYSSNTYGDKAAKMLFENFLWKNLVIVAGFGYSYILRNEPKDASAIRRLREFVTEMLPVTVSSAVRWVTWPVVVTAQMMPSVALYKTLSRAHEAFSLFTMHDWVWAPNNYIQHPVDEVTLSICDLFFGQSWERVSDIASGLPEDASTALMTKSEVREQICYLYGRHGALGLLFANFSYSNMLYNSAVQFVSDREPQESENPVTNAMFKIKSTAAKYIFWLFLAERAPRERRLTPPKGAVDSVATTVNTQEYSYRGSNAYTGKCNSASIGCNTDVHTDRTCTFQDRILKWHSDMLSRDTLELTTDKKYADTILLAKEFLHSVQDAIIE